VTDADRQIPDENEILERQDVRPSVNPDIPEAALPGLEAQKQKIDEHIAELHRMLPARRPAAY
jgi:hypothetical protein